MTTSNGSTLSVPARIEWQALNCPACNEPLDLDRDGTSCTRCRGLLVQRVWADRLLPAMGRPALPPVFQSTPRDLECPACRRAMAPVLMHGVAAWSCAACRWLFIEGPKKSELLEPNARAVVAPPGRALSKPSFIMVATERAKDAAKSPKLRDALAILVLVALIVAVVVVEVHPT
jgi:ribosomal protein L37AE/L43A